MSGSMNPFNASFWSDVRAYVQTGHPADSILAWANRQIPESIKIMIPYAKDDPAMLDAAIDRTTDAIQRASTHTDGPNKGKSWLTRQQAHDLAANDIYALAAQHNRDTESHNDAIWWVGGAALGFGLVFLLFRGRR